MTDEEQRELSPDDVDVFDPSGKMLYFSVRTFVDEIAQGDLCFICGVSPVDVPFNNEHVIPDWILSAYELHSRNITLSNQAQQMYGRYTVPCCEQCNLRMAATFEAPISALIKAGYDAVMNYMLKEGPWLIFQWLTLIFLKAHLKDKQFRLHLDRRRGGGMISHLYEWRELHHIHCIARAFYTNAVIDNSVIGTLLLWRAENPADQEQFDYGDSYEGRTIMLRLGETVFIAVLNDACAVRVVLGEAFQKMPIPLSLLQLREMMTRMAYTNIRLKDRPKFQSWFDGLFLVPERTKKRWFAGKYRMIAEMPEMFFLEEFDPRELGEMLVANLRGAIRGVVPPEEQESLVEMMRDGLHSFILHDGSCVMGMPVNNDVKPEEA
jgi:hypothetical protein